MQISIFLIVLGVVILAILIAVIAKIVRFFRNKR